MLMFGGGLGGDSPCSNETWVLSNAGGAAGSPSWALLGVSGAPGVRFQHSAVYDAASNRMIVFGGGNCFAFFYNDVWVLSNANGLAGTPVWTQLSPAGPAPAPRVQASAVYDSANNALVIYGGTALGGPLLGDVWVLSHANGSGGTPAWTQLAPGAGPDPRSGHGAVYDPASGRMTVFGGFVSSGFANDLWILEHAAGVGGTPFWTQVGPLAPAPPGRGTAALTVDPASARLTLFGGYGGASLNDVWVLGADSTPPVIVPTVTGPLGANGWRTGPTTVTWSVTDAESPVTNLVGCDPATLATDTPGQTLTCTATSGGGASSQSVTLKIDQTPPALSGSRSPAPNGAGWNNSDVTVTFTCADALSGPAFVTPATAVSSEGAGQSVSGVCQDVAGNTSGASVTGINIDKTPPVVGSLAALPNPVPVNTPSTLTASLTDGGSSGLLSAGYSVNGGAAAPFGSPSGASADVSATVGPFPASGIYSICATARDVAENTSAAECLLLPVYDPDGGFVTGGGWITSPPGAYAPNPSLTGKATFGFVSKYKPGANIPSGETQFQFRAAGLDFKSTAYEWLVIAGARAQYKGTGSINGAGAYEFLLTAIDGDQLGGGGVDRLRLKVFGPSGVVYDNEMSSPDSADPTSALGGGSIVIHK